MVRVYINRHVVAANQKSGAREPPITILRKGGDRSYALAVDLIGAARVVYSPDKPLSCGARVWIECDDAMAVANDRVSLTVVPAPPPRVRRRAADRPLPVNFPADRTEVAVL